MKSYKTTLIGIFGALSLIIVGVLLVFSIVSVQDAMLILGGIGAFIGTILGFVSKDHNVSGKP